MKTENEFETTYAETLKECIELLNQENYHEREKISLSIEIGKKVDELAAKAPNKNFLFKRLSRDILKARGKVISPSKIAEYQQLYLNFQSMDIVTTMEKSLVNDVTVGMLTEIALNDGRQKSKPSEDAFPLLTILNRTSRLLNRFEVDMEEKQPEGQELTEILKELEAIVCKTGTILNTVKNTGGRAQMDMFNMNIN